MTIEIDVSVAAWPIAYDVIVHSGILIDVAVDTRPTVVVVGQLFPDIHVPTDHIEWLDYAPHGIGTGANVKVPLDAVQIESFAPSIQIGVRLAPSADGMTWSDFAPAVYIGGARVVVPLDAAEFAEFAPTIQSGVNLDIPFNLATWRDSAPGIGYGVDISVPDDNVEFADIAPLVVSGVNVNIVTDTGEWVDFSPSLSVSIEAPNDAMVWGDYAPTISVGVRVAVPADSGEWVEHEVIVVSGATVPAPVDGMEWQDYAPVIVSGAGMEFPSDETVWTDYAPLIAAGVNLAVPVSLMDWRDFGVVAGYGFSAGFSSGFNALPSAAGAGVLADAMDWTDFAPTVEADASADLTYLGVVASSSGTSATQNFANVPFGAEAPDRVVSIAVTWITDNDDIVSATIGGVTAQIDVSQLVQQSNGAGAGVISAAVPTGETGAVQIVFSGSVSNFVRINPCRIVGLVEYPTITDADSANAGSSGNTSLFVQTKAGGVAVCAACGRNSGNQYTLTGATEDYDQTVASSWRMLSGSYEATTAEAAHEIGFQNSQNNGAVVAVSYR